MHDIDRTTLEFGQQEFEEEFEFGQGEWSGESGPQGMFSETEEMELANELLSVSNEAELEQFLGNLLSKAASFAGKIIKSPVGQAIGGVLKGVAKKALPLAGGALGGYFGGPLGAKIGSGLASAASNALGLEMEMGEDREFEGAKQFVRLAADTVNRASQARGGDPRTIAQQAAVAAARQLAPGLLGKSAGASSSMQGQWQGQGQGQGGMSGYGSSGKSCGSGGMGGVNGGQGQRGPRGHSGRWMRHGQKIVLYGA
jgi:hypothetical protein